MPIPPPPGNHSAFAHVVSPRGEAFTILSQPWRLSTSIPQGDPQAFDTQKTDKFIGKDEAFVKDWLVHQGLEKLVHVFKGMYVVLIIRNLNMIRVQSWTYPRHKPHLCKDERVSLLN